MKKNLITLLILLLLPLTISAQGAGGKITRKKPTATTSAPAKKQTTTTSKTKPRGTSQRRTSASSSSRSSASNAPTIGTSSYSPNVNTFYANGVSFQMVEVRGGTFQMGGTSEQGSDAERDEKPVHNVTLSSYYIGKTEVTQALWMAIMGSNPSNFIGDNKPVECVNWEDCQTFISKLNNITGKNFRMPTEAEWEFASRGGTKSQGYKYSGSNNLNSVAWYDDNSGRTTHDVGQKSPNELGLYDMSGNVWEWCSDWGGSYSSSSQTNPTGASSGSARMFRGGCWYFGARECRSSSRGGFTPSFRSYDLGLRLAQ